MGIFKEVFKGVLYRILPIKSDRVVFTSLNGQYSDSPKAISIKLHQMKPKYEIIWLVNKSLINSLPKYVTCIDINSWKAQLYKGSARIIIDNVYADNAVTIYNNDKFAKIRAKIFLFLHNKKKQFCITTWHGTPLKCMGIDQIDSNVTDFLCNDTTMILGDRYTLEIMKRLTFNRMNMKLIGTARNDILFNKMYASDIKEQIGIKKEKKVILFAPTFRSSIKKEKKENIQQSGINQLNDICCDELFTALSNKFGGEWVFICRFHYHVASMVDWEKLEKKYPGKFINGNKMQDMADYLSCSDILLTDASSCMFDFALTQKPCFIYFPDIENYEYNERGFYVPMQSLPFPIAITRKQLIENINNFDSVLYKEVLDKMKQEFGFIQDENASEKIVNFIMENISVYE